MAMISTMALAVVLLVVGTVIYGLALEVQLEEGMASVAAILPIVAMGYGTLAILALAVVELRFYLLRARDLERREAKLSAAVSDMEMENESRSESIAGMLHDDIGGGLTALRMELEMAERKCDPVSFARCYRALDRLLGVVRGLSRTFHHKLAESLGLEEAMRDLADTFGGAGRQTLQFDFEGDLNSLPPVTSLCVLRVVQEAVVNAARHSNGTSVRIVVANRGNAVFGTISDNGRGKTAFREGVGLALMRERVRSLGGSLDVRVSRGGGVEVAFCLPIGSEREGAA